MHKKLKIGRFLKAKYVAEYAKRHSPHTFKLQTLTIQNVRLEKAIDLVSSGH